MSEKGRSVKWGQDGEILLCCCDGFECTDRRFESERWGAVRLTGVLQVDGVSCSVVGPSPGREGYNL